MQEKLLDTGSWYSDNSSHYNGGQAMHYQITNVNILGTTISIDSNLDGSKSILIPPQVTMDLIFTCFGNEPMGWKFDISSDSDAFIVNWKLFSTWVPGDPPNPPQG